MIFGSNASIIEFADFEGNSTTRVEGEKGLGNLLRNVRYVVLTASAFHCPIHILWFKLQSALHRTSPHHSSNHSL
jgi:hypothetical protein